MKLTFAILCFAAVAFAANVTEAGFGCLTCRSAPGCSSCGVSSAPVIFAAPRIHRVAPTCGCPVPAAPTCSCAQPARGCCSTMAALGNPHGSASMPGYALGQPAAVHMHGGMPNAGGFTGYEGQPTQFSGTTHERLPYHSYRRPWADPGPRSINGSLVW